MKLMWRRNDRNDQIQVQTRCIQSLYGNKSTNTRDSEGRTKPETELVKLYR